MSHDQDIDMDALTYLSELPSPVFLILVCLHVHFVLCNVTTCRFVCLAPRSRYRTVLLKQVFFLLPFDNYTHLPSSALAHIHKPRHYYIYFHNQLYLWSELLILILLLMSILNKFNINLHKIYTDIKNIPNY